MALVFQYGSNCSAARLNGHTRLNGVARAVGIAETVDDYTLTFDVWSDSNDCAAANIVKAPGRKVWGVLYEIPDDFIRGPRNDGRKTLKQIEGKRYCEITLPVRRLDREKRDAATFVVREKFQEEGLKTSAEYVSHIVQGLREQGVSNDYIREVKRISAENNAGIGQAVDAL